jgi:hypothetical protein
MQTLPNDPNDNWTTERKRTIMAIIEEMDTAHDQLISIASDNLQDIREVIVCELLQFACVLHEQPSVPRMANSKDEEQCVQLSEWTSQTLRCAETVLKSFGAVQLVTMKPATTTRAVR